MKKNSTGQGSSFLPANPCPGLSLSHMAGHAGGLRGAGQCQLAPACEVPAMVQGGFGDSGMPSCSDAQGEGERGRKASP